MEITLALTLGMSSYGVQLAVIGLGRAGRLREELRRFRLLVSRVTGSAG